MQILVNDSPFAGRDGKFVTARHLRERLIRETRGNVSLQVSDTETAGAFEINARGEMQIAILVEQMRREGYELMVSRPEVIFHRNESGELLEPLENLYVDLPDENLGAILQSIANRKGEILAIDHHASRVTIEAIIPTRGLIGFETDLVNLTRGEGFMAVSAPCLAHDSLYCSRSESEKTPGGEVSRSALTSGVQSRLRRRYSASQGN